MEESSAQLFSLAELVARCDKRDAPYLEFLRVPALSCGIYQLSSGEEDHQDSHDEDEVYFVLKGKAYIVRDGEKERIEPGSILYIPAGANHQFVEIEEDLSLLVFFGSGGPSGAEV